jgi:hypothetical protein
LRSTVDEGPRDPDDGVCVPNEAPCVPEEELGEDDDVVPDVVPVLLLVCDIVDVNGVSEGSRTSKLNHIRSIFPVSRKMMDNLHEHIDDRKIGTSWDGYMNRMFTIRSTGPLSNYI